VPVAHGSDGGGSIRIPAACTGLFGLKPARGRISRGPDLGDHFLSTDGALTRSVADCAALLDVLAGYEPGDATWAPPPSRPFAEAAGDEPGRLRVGLTLDLPIEGELDPVCGQAARDAGELLESLGHDVEEFEAPWTGANLLDVFSVLWAAQVAGSVRHGQMVSGNEATEENVEPMSWWLYQRGVGYTALDLVSATAVMQGFARRVISDVWSRFDVVLTPALAQRPVRIGEIDTMGENPAWEFKKSGMFTPYTALFNVSGQPAMSVPLFQGDDGLPLAVQVAGPPAGEELLLSLAAQLEQAHPWADRRPQLERVQ
jgi:amidase